MMSSRKKPPRLDPPRRPRDRTDATKILWASYAATMTTRISTKRFPGLDFQPKVALQVPCQFAEMPKLTPQQILQGSPLSITKPGSKKLRRTLSIDRTLDLHGMIQPQAFQALITFIHRCFQAQEQHVLIITGKGLRVQEGKVNDVGILRRQLPQWLEHPDLRPYIHSATNTHPFPGGTGAFYIHLRKNKKS